MNQNDYPTHNKGIVESIYRISEYLILFFLTKIKLYALKLRGYSISSSCKLSLSSKFFQSNKGCISLSGNTVVGCSVQIKSGFGGLITIGHNTCIYDFSIIDAQQEISIGNNCLIAPFCYIADYDHANANSNKPIKDQGYIAKKVTIGDNVWLGAHASVLKGVSIGKGSIIGANSVVTKSIPANVIAVGNPAKVIKKR